MSNKKINKRSSKKSEQPSNTNSFTSKPIKYNFVDLEDFNRADLEFYGIDHSGPSYEGRIFINNPEADEHTSLTIKQGYVGSYYIFGHGGCFGDVGHCEIHKNNDPYIHKPSHPLSPAYKRIIVTEQIKKLLKDKSEFVITIVPILAKTKYQLDIGNIVMVEKISLVTYK